MSTESEKIRAQELAWNLVPGQQPPRHLIGPAELKGLFTERDRLKAALKVLLDERDFLQAELACEKRLSEAIRRDLMRAEGVRVPT